MYVDFRRSVTYANFDVKTRLQIKKKTFPVKFQIFDPDLRF